MFAIRKQAIQLVITIGTATIAIITRIELVITVVVIVVAAVVAITATAAIADVKRLIFQIVSFTLGARHLQMHHCCFDKNMDHSTHSLLLQLEVISLLDFTLMLPHKPNQMG